MNEDHKESGDHGLGVARPTKGMKLPLLGNHVVLGGDEEGGGVCVCGCC